MTVYSGSLDTTTLKYSSNNIPKRVGDNSLTLTDVSVGSEIDVLHFLGRPASKVLVTFNSLTSSSNVVLTINGVTRVVVHNEEGCDYMDRSWGTNKGFQAVASRISSGTWNSYSNLGNLSIDSIEIDSMSLAGTGATIDIILIA